MDYSISSAYNNVKMYYLTWLSSIDNDVQKYNLTWLTVLVLHTIM